LPNYIRRQSLRPSWLCQQRQLPEGFSLWICKPLTNSFGQRSIRWGVLKFNRKWPMTTLQLSLRKPGIHITRYAGKVEYIWLVGNACDLRIKHTFIILYGMRNGAVETRQYGNLSVTATFAVGVALLYRSCFLSIRLHRHVSITPFSSCFPLAGIVFCFRFYVSMQWDKLAMVLDLRPILISRHRFCVWIYILYCVETKQVSIVVSVTNAYEWTKFVFSRFWRRSSFLFEICI